MLVWFNLISSILMILVYYFQIIVLENGKVVEQGPHDFLLSKGGRYAELWYQQNNSDAVDSAAVSLEV
jgi:ABC transporter ATM